jgi:hypothetical protein
MIRSSDRRGVSTLNYPPRHGVMVAAPSWTHPLVYYYPGRTHLVSQVY